MLKLRIFWGACVWSCASLMANSAVAQTTVPPETSLVFVEKKLLREGFKKDFVSDLLKTYEPDGFRSVIELNVLLYLRKSDYHGPQVTDLARQDVVEFLARHGSVFQIAETRYRVPRTVIASLLWLESRHGKNVGEFHVPSVYVHLIQSPRMAVQNYLFTRTHRYTPSIEPKDKREIVARTHRKAKWALDELRALQKVHRWKWKMDGEMRGSFSGAFGMPQFLPSSYVRWARSAKLAKDAQPVLSRPEDAIMSVGYYLRDHGWKTGDHQAEFEALMKYNNSRDYASAILELASRVTP